MIEENKTYKAVDPKTGQTDGYFKVKQNGPIEINPTPTQYESSIGLKEYIVGIIVLEAVIAIPLGLLFGAELAFGFIMWYTSICVICGLIGAAIGWLLGEIHNLFGKIQDKIGK